MTHFAQSPGTLTTHARNVLSQYLSRSWTDREVTESWYCSARPEGESRNRAIWSELRSGLEGAGYLELDPKRRGAYRLTVSGRAAAATE